MLRLQLNGPSSDRSKEGKGEQMDLFKLPYSLQQCSD